MRVRRKLARMGVGISSQLEVADLVLAEVSRHRIQGDQGFYIECGAYDGLAASNTIALERLGWRGLLVEPSPAAFTMCRKNRSPKNFFASCALVADSSTLEVVGDFDGSPMASIGGVRRSTRDPQLVSVPARTLQSLLDEHGIHDVDFFSLDVEGGEVEVLRGLDLRRCTPSLTLIEVYSQNQSEVFRMMTSAGYDPPINLSNFSFTSHPLWDGKHNDYLFVHRSAKQ